MFDKWFETVKHELIKLIKTTLDTSMEEAAAEAEKFLQSSRQKLNKWIDQLLFEEITTKDFEYLIKSLLDTAELTMFKQAGLTMVHFDRFKLGVLNIFFDAMKKNLSS